MDNEKRIKFVLTPELEFYNSFNHLAIDSIFQYVIEQWDERELTKQELEAIVARIEDRVGYFLHENIVEVIGQNC